MKCESCGAELKDGAKFCESCGSQISYEMKREQEQLNKAGCPKCGSSNVTFNREKQGEVQGKNGKAVVRATVGLCKDCGYTWNTSSNNTFEKKKNNMIWWVLGWIFFFPAPVMILIWRKKNTWPVKTKLIVTVVFWIVFFLLGGINNSTGNTSSGTENVETTSEEITHIYDNAEVVDLMNGFGTDKIGTITICKANQSECTEDAIIDWYFNYVKKNTDSNYHIIVYSDNTQKGIYTPGSGFIQKDIELTAEDDGTYMLGDDAGSKYYTVDETSKTLSMLFDMADASIVEDVKAKVDAIIPAEYKNSDMYAVDVAGEEGALDCNLTLVNGNFADGNCQSIAEEIATKVKELDLGIGYFSIAFQSDDYTIQAISNVDNLSSQDVSEITTQGL